MNNSKGRGAGRNPRPSLFDIALYAFVILCSVFFLKGWDTNIAQGIFFCFGTLFLYGLSHFCERKVDYSNQWLGAVVIWSLISVFLHSFDVSLKDGIYAVFINYCLLSEGFIYVLCGVILFKLIVSYSDKFDIFYPVLILNILNLFFVITQKFGMKLIWANIPTVCGAMGTIYQLKVFTAFSLPILACRRWGNNNNTWLPFVLIPIAILVLIFKTNVGISVNSIIAFAVALSIYLYLKKQSFRIIILIPLVFPFILLTENLWHKVMFRIGLGLIMLKEIASSPVFGLGFSNSIMGNTVLTKHGWFLPQNDYLNIARDLGIPFLVFILIIIWKVLRKSRIDYLWLSIIVLAVNCFVQTSMYYPRIAVWVILAVALKEREIWDANTASAESAKLNG